MSWNLKEQSLGTYVVGASLGANTSVNSGSAIPYQIYTGTTSHGITVSSGVFTCVNTTVKLRITAIVSNGIDTVNSATPKNHWAGTTPGAYIGVPWYAVLSF